MAARYDKPVLSHQQHVALWQERGLLVPDVDKALHYLKVISYYRLSAYAKPLQTSDSDHRFREGTCFDDLLDLYVFDRELRLLILDALERLEVALRACMTNVLSAHHGSHAYIDPDIFHSGYDHDWLLGQVRKKSNSRDAETFLAHYRHRYTEPELPPIWMVMEILTFKEVCVLLSKLRMKQDKQAIGESWGIPDALLVSWFRTLSDLRNICAHHARLWNRVFGSRPQRPRRKLSGWLELQPVSLGNSNIDPYSRLYGMLVIIQFLLHQVNPESTWHCRLHHLLQRYPNISRAGMGMPADWFEQPFWGLTG